MVETWQALTIPYHIDCQQWWNRPVNYLRVATDLNYKNGGASFVLCAYTSWSYNDSESRREVESIDLGSGSPPCGTDEYQTQGFGGYRNGSTWYDGDIVSANIGHNLPS